MLNLPDLTVALKLIREKILGWLSTKKHLAFFVTGLLVVLLVVLSLYLISSKTTKRALPGSGEKVSSGTNYLETQLLGVKDGDLQILATIKGSTQVVQVSATGYKFFLKIYNPKTFEVREVQQVSARELRSGDKVRFYSKKSLTEVPKSLDEVQKVEVYREQTK